VRSAEEWCADRIGNAVRLDVRFERASARGRFGERASCTRDRIEASYVTQ
jgi:hypothetical protein